MPFKCCMGNHLKDASNDGNEDCDLIKKVPKPIDLNEGYNSQIELLIFNNRINNNPIHQGFNSMKSSSNRLKYNSKKYFNTAPVTFVETKVSNLLNTPGGPAIAETSSNVILSGCNSPIKLVTSIEATPKSNNLNYIEPPVISATANLNQTSTDHSFVKKKVSEDNNFREKKTNEIEEINKDLEFSKESDQKIKYIDIEDPNFTLATKSDQSQKELKNYSIRNEDELEYENGKIQKYINTKNLCNESNFDTINKTDNDKISNFETFNIKNGIDKLVFLSNQLKNESNQIDKKKKKSKKTIHIEISFSPKNNIFVDAQHNQNKNKNKLEPHNKIKLKSSDSNEQNHTQSEDFFESNKNKNISVDSSYINPLGSDEKQFEVIQKADCYKPTINNKSNEVCTSECENMAKEYTHIKDNNLTVEEISNILNNVSSILPFNEIEKIQNIAGKQYCSSFEEHSNIAINSFEKLIPFIDEPEAIMNDSSNLDKGEKCKFPVKKELINSLTDIKQPNNKLIELSRETLEKLNGSLPIVESDPQMAQLFASAQVRIEDINNQNESFENSKLSEESDPVDSIVKFLDNPSKYKDSICWATIKAIKEVYEPQIEYAKKELDRWMNSENNSDETKENIEYYSNLVSELQEKVILAEKARELLLTKYESDEVQLMLQNEKKTLEEIKKKIGKESNQLKSIEEQYLNGRINLKEDVRASRIKIRNLENELKSKLAEIHKLEESLRIHENH
ncbi:uncharacterized protein ELE39_002687 [Cryptosporidium sp. chipmunk genotype I]|uniref:uncharacterized protein n=1 Tax=Cryptosporidium sp. chipmunk genotype I TaxID=1280935 RepID=UPI00351A51DC|nr:hypothetical protein ELE39_002687 [Cryptosporidium sp. chipmunk genotype I]